MGLEIHRKYFQKTVWDKPGKAAHAGNSSTREEEDQEFRANLSYKVSLRSAWATQEEKKQQWKKYQDSDDLNRHVYIPQHFS